MSSHLRGVLRVGRLRFDAQAIEDALALARLERAQVIGKRHRRVAGGDVDVERRDPEGVLGTQLIDRDREAARAGRVEPHGQSRRARRERRIAQQPACGVGVAARR